MLPRRGNHLIAARGYREPGSNRDIFQILEEEGILDAALGEKMRDMASLRNVVVHDYTRVDPAVVYAIFQRGLHDLEQFARVIRDVAPRE